MMVTTTVLARDLARATARVAELEELALAAAELVGEQAARIAELLRRALEAEQSADGLRQMLKDQGDTARERIAELEAALEDARKVMAHVGLGGNFIVPPDYVVERAAAVVNRINELLGEQTQGESR